MVGAAMLAEGFDLWPEVGPEPVRPVHQRTGSPASSLSTPGGLCSRARRVQVGTRSWSWSAGKVADHDGVGGGFRWRPPGPEGVVTGVHRREVGDGVVGAPGEVQRAASP